MRKIFLLILPVAFLVACNVTPTTQDPNQQLDLAGDSGQAGQTLDLTPPEESSNTTVEREDMQTQTAVISTSKGEITLELYPEAAPETVANFIEKANSGYYEGLTFHRVEDWVIQGGDPLGNGTGGGKMATELNDVPFVTGSLGVARGGDIKVSNDSQFFICTKDCSWLDKQYTNFGLVTEGMDVATSMEIGDTIESIQITSN